jgi:phosphoribosyl 1,2-cyclic phosphodiesterase
MSLYISSINSGSNGNCYYIGNDTEAVLIDAGLSCRETEKRMKRCGLQMDKVRAIFISHEHGDHIRGLEGLASRHKLPVYITSLTLQKSRLRLPKDQLMPLKSYSPVQIGSLTVHTFPKFHDAIDPHSFVIEGNGLNIGVFTDIGIACRHVTNHFKECHAAFLEANYDDGMLEQGRYPVHLKQRIKGNSGHLSNQQARDMFMQYRPANMSHLFLSHLSKDNNCPELAYDFFKAHAGNTQIVIASRYQETGVYNIRAAGVPVANVNIPFPARQMVLF